MKYVWTMFSIRSFPPCVCDRNNTNFLISHGRSRCKRYTMTHVPMRLSDFTLNNQTAQTSDGVTNPCVCVHFGNTWLAFAGVAQNAESRIWNCKFSLTEFVRKACNWLCRHSPCALSNCVDVFMHACAHANDRHRYKLNYFHPIQIAPKFVAIGAKEADFIA